MKIIVFGASGTIGRAVVAEMANHCDDIIKVNRTSSADYQVDICDENQIQQLYEKIGQFDALIATTGKVHFDMLENFDRAKWDIGLNNKLMGQVNLVMHGLQYINDGGSFTLTSGLLNCDPIPQACSAAMVNSALEGFVNAAAISLPRGIRINIVSPTLLEESVELYGDFFKGYVPVSSKLVAKAYLKSVAGKQTGQIYRVGW